MSTHDFTCPLCGSHMFGSSETTGYCHGRTTTGERCRFNWALDTIVVTVDLEDEDRTPVVRRSAFPALVGLTMQGART